MLINDFYFIIEKCITEVGFDVKIKLNSEHQIFQAHFPGNPITPGVCILQISEELLSNHYNKSLTMVTAKNIKFLNILNPISTNEVWFKIQLSVYEPSLIKASILVEFNSISFAKISSTYKPE